MTAGRAPVLLAPLLLGLAGCERWPAALDPHSPEASSIASLIWGFVALLGAIWLAVVIASLLAIRRSRADAASAEPHAYDAAAERRRTAWVSVLTAATAVIVLVLTGFSYATQRVLFGPREEDLTILATGHQWWWELRYEDADPSRIVETANEIHVPVDVPVTLKLESSDVIHSLWVPSLMGKIDLIPGRQNYLRFKAAAPGVYRGQCAEFCGVQHAHMGLLVVAEPVEDFERWRDAQRRTAVQPSDPERQAGHDAFLKRPCVMCHAIRGAGAGGRSGPDLTHVGGRRTIGAGTLPVTRGALAAWIVDPHGVKPGVDMPMVKLDPDELNAISAYLESLK
ncbi:cytochrome c oxidase subunit II [Alsobacter sp. SYSU BS001988]|jgi:cytochrome c oxidase subunit 2